MVFAAPPQHGKTQITLHGLVWLILKHPTKRHAYITYSQDRARSVARMVRRILRSVGVKVEGTLDMMTFPGLSESAQCKFTSIDGGITGEPVDGVAIIDDPYKNRKEADSPTRRKVVMESYQEAIETRVHPGASIFLLATRWHPQDLSGTCEAEGWQVINLPAIAEDNDANGRAVGEALFPLMWPIEALEDKRKNVGEFAWAALYQGRPRPKGGKIFRGVTHYTELPTRYQGAFGIDLAYSAKTVSDWSICLELWREDRPNGEPLFYIVRVDRAQVEAADFADTLQKRHNQRPSFTMLWRASGVEKGAASFMIKDRDLPVEVQNPPGDKLVSATAVSAAWNQGRVLVPDLCPQGQQDDGEEDWLSPFLQTVADFTGTGKEHDDDVDALGNAHAALDEVDIMSAMRAVKDRGGRVFV